MTLLGWGAENLAVDASFESPLPSWFAERAGTSYYAGKEQVDGAADGRMVLAIEAWDRQGSRILSRPIDLDPVAREKTASGTVRVRSFGKPHGATLELALYDEKGAKRLASFGQLPLDGARTWRELAGRAVSVEPGARIFRLALVVSGPHEGARVEVDQIGLFQGAELPAVTDNSDLAVIEAEELADGTVWKAVDHYPNWYNGTPSGMKMLAGFDPLKSEQNRPVTKPVAVRQSGRHRLWVRLHTNDYAGEFALAMRQSGRTVVERTIAGHDAKYPRWAWAWESVDVDLRPGEAELVLSRPAAGASGHARKLDLLVLTNRVDYVPQVEHFRPQGYLRFVHLATDQEPFCLWFFIRRHQGPQWYANPGILSRAGLSESYYVPADRGKWLAAGQSSPWVRISDYLLAAGGRNNVQAIATRQMHTTGFVSGPLRGRLEFAVGNARSVVKTVAVDQAGPRMLLTLPPDFQAQPDQIKSALDYIRETEAELDKLGPSDRPAARHLNLAANLSFQAGVDDPEVIRREIAIIKRLGFNQTYHLPAPPEQALQFCAQHGLLPRFGGGPALWSLVQHGSQHHPDEAAMARSAAKFATDNRPILDRFVRYKLMDEPGGMSYETIAGSAACREKFAQWLRKQAVTPAELGVRSWDEVAPVTPQDSQTKPALFYYSGLFRLESLPALARACVRAKKTCLPDSMLTYVNYSPPTSGGSWTERGTDLFFAHRDGGMEMTWTEDWLGWSVGPQHLSDVLALARAAGRPQRCRLGAYCVGQGTPVLMRMKYYTLVAGGVRDIECYDYGPWYAGIDSWGRRFNLYGAIRDCNFELGAIDQYLEGTTRRKSELAILYNRAASIWAQGNNACTSNASFTHWALAHAGYDADFLAEEDVTAGQLSRYKVLYVDGPQLRQEAARAIAEWVRRGGVLFGSAGAGSRDQYDRPLPVLEPVFAARSKDLVVKASPGRPKYELRALRPLDRLTPTSEFAAETPALDQLCFQESLEPLAEAKVILRNREGRPAGTIHRPGRGTAIRVTALPGVSYVQEAVGPRPSRDQPGAGVDAARRGGTASGVDLPPPYDPESYLPTQFRQPLRDLIAWPARLAGAARVATASSPIAEVVRYDGQDRCVVFLIDHRGESTASFSVELFHAEGYTRALAASGCPVQLSPGRDGSLKLTLRLNVCDAIVLLK
jgi:hypothetical protein